MLRLWLHYEEWFGRPHRQPRWRFSQDVRAGNQTDVSSWVAAHWVLDIEWPLGTPVLALSSATPGLLALVTFLLSEGRMRWQTKHYSLKSNPPCRQKIGKYDRHLAPVSPPSTAVRSSRSFLMAEGSLSVRSAQESCILIHIIFYLKSSDFLYPSAFHPSH